MGWNPESKHVGGWFGLETTQVSNRVVQRVGILNPNTLGNDLTWGLPKSQIEWSNGLESWIQTRRGMIWLGDYPSLKSSGPTVWNPESKHVGGWFGLGTTQVLNRVVQWFGILNPNTSEGGVIWLGDYPSLKSSDPTVWHSHRGGDLAWGLPKSQIEWSNGLESWIQTRRGVIWLGDYPSLKSSGSTVWNPESKHVGGWFGLGTTQISNQVVQRFGILNPNASGVIWLGDYPNHSSPNWQIH